MNNTFILEERTQNVTTIDIFSRLLSDRIIFLGEEIDDRLANQIQAQLLYLDAAAPGTPIKLYINSPGGEVYAGLGIYDCIKSIQSPVYTVCTGLAASMGAIILAAGEPGHRKSLPHARILIHQPSGGAAGTSSDVTIAAKEIEDVKKVLAECLEHDTNQPYKKVIKDIDRDKWMSVEEALQYGIIDGVVESKKTSEILKEDDED